MTNCCRFLATMQLINQGVFMIALAAVYAIAAVLATTATNANAREGDPPRIAEHARTRQTVEAGTRVFRLHCPAESDTELMVQWRKDGELIGAAWGERFRFGNGHRTLRIKNVLVEDTGRYTCEAVNGFGRRVLEFTLIVYGKDDQRPSDFGKYEYSPDEINVGPSWVNARELHQLVNAPIVKAVGAKLRLDCAASGDPRPDVSWYRNGRAFRSHQTRNRFAIAFDALALTDAGTYACHLKNTYGSLNATFYLQVVERDRQPPEFEDSAHLLANSTVREGQMATFQCKVKSLAAAPHIKWLKQIDERSAALADNSSVFQAHGMSLMVLDRYPSETLARPDDTYVNQLVLPLVRPANAGWYICVVTSPSGHMVYRMAHLKVVPAESHVPSLTEAITAPQLFVGLPLVALVAVLVGYAIYFLQRHRRRQKPPSPPFGKTVVGAANSSPGGSIALRRQPPPPPPPARPPPLLPGGGLGNPYKGTPSPRLSAGGNNYGRPEHRQLMGSTAYYTRSPGVHSNLDGVAAYHHLEQQPPPSHIMGASAAGGVGGRSLKRDDRDGAGGGLLYETTTPSFWQTPTDDTGGGGSDVDDDDDDDFDYPPPAGRLQPYPSLYSCR